MPVQLPSLSLDQKNERLNKIQTGALYPLSFIFNWDTSVFPGTSGDSGAFKYVQQIYQSPTFIGITQIDSDIATISPYTSIIMQVSLADPPTFLDPASNPLDSGNILYTKAVYKEQNFGSRSHHTSYYPGVFPIVTGQRIFLNVINYPEMASPSNYIVSASFTVHVLYTGLQI